MKSSANNSGPAVQAASAAPSVPAAAAPVAASAPAAAAAATPAAPAPAPSKSFKYVLLGGGTAAGYAAREFVKRGITESVLIVGDEPYTSYERPALSKGFLGASAPARLPGFHTCVGEGGERQTPEWYAEKGIEFKTGTKVTAVSVSDKALTLGSGEVVGFENLIIATGCRPLSAADIKLEGASLDNVVTLRNVSDGLDLVSRLEAVKAAGGKVAVVGGGYMGLEVSAGVAGWGIPVSVITPADRLLDRLFTPKIAAVYESFYGTKGITIIKGEQVVGIATEDGKAASGVKTKSGKTIEASLVLVGVGAKPNVDLFQGQLAFEAGGIKVDGNFRTSVPGVYAVGDVAAFPLLIDGGKTSRQEHVTFARRSAEHAVASLIDQATPAFDYLPFFYSREFAFSWRLWGLSRGEVVHFGEFEAGKSFGAYFVEDGKVVGTFYEGGGNEEAAFFSAVAKKKPAAPPLEELAQLGLEFAKQVAAAPSANM